MNFLRMFRVPAIFAAALMIGFFILNDYAYRNSKDQDEHVTKVASNIQDIMNRPASDLERRDAIIDAIFKENSLAFGKMMAEHLAEAFLIAAVMIFSVEGPTKYLAAKKDEDFVEKISQGLAQQAGDISSGFAKQANEISSNVWNAIFRKLVPDPIAKEIQKILKSDVSRIRPNFIITLSDTNYKGLLEDEIVVRRQLSYRLKNLTDDTLDYTVTFEIRQHSRDREVQSEDGQKIILPRILEVGIKGAKHPIGPESRQKFQQPVRLPPMTSDSEAWEVYSDVEELFRVKDRVLYVMTAPTAGVDVLVINNSSKAKVSANGVYLTSGLDRLVPSMEGRWSYDGGLLSGTALSVAWEPAHSKNDPLVGLNHDITEPEHNAPGSGEK